MRKVSLMMIVSTLLLPACGSKLPSVKPFSMDVQQGNVVNSKMLLQLRPGMTKSQVRYIMGTPLVVDTFHDNRWYYSYAMRKDGQVAEKRSVILDFEKDALLRVRGDVTPEGDASVKDETVTPPISVAKAPVPVEKTWWQKLKFWGGDEDSQSVVPADTTVAAVETKPASQELKVAPELVAEGSPNEVVSPEVIAATAVAAEIKSVENVAEANVGETSEKPWWEKLKFWGNNQPEQATTSVNSVSADVVPPTVVEEKPATPELKAAPEPVVETVAKEVVAPEPVAAVAVVTETKTEQNVAESNTAKATEKSWWERFKFWGNDKPAVAEATVVEEKPATPELKVTPEPVVEAASSSATVAEAQATEPAVTSSVVAANPVKEVVTTAPSVVSVKEEIATTVASWAEAWRSKNLKAYLAKYADDFKPDALPNKKAWEAQRKQRLSAKQGTISLDISNVQVQQNGDKVAVQFLQKYASKVYSDQVTKKLDLRLDPATKKWLIVREVASAPTK